MNLREGTRRLALLLGAVGAIIGGFASYMQLQTVLDQRARHNRFEQLATSDVVQQVRKKVQAEPNDWQTIPDDKWAKYAVKSEHTQYYDPNTGEPILIDPQTGHGIETDKKTGQSFEIDPKTGERIQAAPDFLADAIPISSEVNKGGIIRLTQSRQRTAIRFIRHRHRPYGYI
jgi:hypothetical protein